MGILEDEARKAYALSLLTAEEVAAARRVEAERKERQRQRDAISKQLDSLMAVIGDRDQRPQINFIEDLSWGVVALLTGEPMRFTTTLVKDNFGGKHNLVMLGKCPKCGKETASGPVQGLLSVGELLNSFRPDESHQCYKE